MHAQYFAPVNLNPKLQLCAIIVAPSFWFSLSGPALFLLRHVASPSFWPQPRPLSSRHVKWNLQPAILLSQSLLIRKSHGMNYCKIHSLLSWALQKLFTPSIFAVCRNPGLFSWTCASLGKVWINCVWPCPVPGAASAATSGRGRLVIVATV